ncbi:ribonuclease HII [Metabacillus idriensis]|uniref:Ribonuclease HII n=1 Tax=Metabacillus idriensis TaxID=324768 RepID=A0A6I2MB37_9BACI|nr:ribonuclease HII [Metabacillus idriensis]MCM3594319.1 ribonuclease HII [Metabacillus idriensis]MRX53651.1 ribonuclease HII [Metabacillus idriensis]
MKKQSTDQIRQKLIQVQHSDDPFLLECIKDERKSVQALVNKWMRKFEQKKKDMQMFEDMMTFERQARDKGYKYICGIDEVGRGPLAGPVVAAAVILPEEFYLPGLTDSKKLSAEKRDLFYETILSEAVAYGVGIISPAQIDELNIYQATKAAMLKAVDELAVSPEYMLIDAMELALPIPQESLIKGDARSVSIAAASVVAKVTRDRIMKKLAETFPQYGFDQNMGYGTKLHLEALNRDGITDYHRKSFSPVKEMALIK